MRKCRPALAAISLILLTACGRAAPSPVDATPHGPAPEAPHPQAQPTVQPVQGNPAFAKEPPPDLPSLPLWGTPGTDTGLSHSFAPLKVGERTLQPVTTNLQTYYFFRDGDAVWLAGYDAFQGGLAGEQSLLYHLPLKVGDRWTTHHDAAIGPAVPTTYAVVGFDTISAPAGTFPAVVLDTGGEREWWSPGVGLVKRGDQTATQVKRDDPATVPIAARLDAVTTGILGRGGVMDQAGNTLFTIPDLGSKTWQFRNFWADAGGPAPLLILQLHSQAPPNSTYTAYAYQPDRRTFERVTWPFPDGPARTSIGGMLESKDGALAFRDDQRYPWRTYRFRWDHGGLVTAGFADAYAVSEENFAFQITRPLDRESFLRLFADTAVGVGAYSATHQNGGNTLLGRFVRRDQAGSWTVDGTVFHFTVRRGTTDWQIATWTP